MRGPRILKHYDTLTALTKALRERVDLCESRGEVLLVDGTSLFELLEAIRKGDDAHTFYAEMAKARVAMVRAGRPTGIYCPDMSWRPLPN